MRLSMSHAACKRDNCMILRFNSLYGDVIFTRNRSDVFFSDIIRDWTMSSISSSDSMFIAWCNKSSWCKLIWSRICSSNVNMDCVSFAKWSPTIRVLIMAFVYFLQSNCSSWNSSQSTSKVFVNSLSNRSLGLLVDDVLWNFVNNCFSMGSCVDMSQILSWQFTRLCLIEQQQHRKKKKKKIKNTKIDATGTKLTIHGKMSFTSFIRAAQDN